MAVQFYIIYIMLFYTGVSNSWSHEGHTWNKIMLHTDRSDPQIDMNASEIIKSKGYPCEDYDVHTRDGYIISVQRIPHGKYRHYADVGRPVVLLQHGLLGSSADWVLNTATESLGFILADTGFDVWLGNNRGNMYALRHESLTPHDEKFWDFSWDEMAAFDFPATVDRVLKVTGARQLVYVGYSQGSQIAFAQLSRDKSMSRKIGLFIALAPIAYLGHVKSPLKYLAPYGNDLGFLFTLFGVKDFLPSNWLSRWIARNMCGDEPLEFICENMLFLLGGFDYRHMNMSRIPVYVSHVPAGTSVRNLVHYAQSVHTGTFRMFDFGKKENQIRYNQTVPPTYFPSAIDVNMALYSGGDDWLANPSDVRTLESELHHVVRHVTIGDWEHLDFTWATNAPAACYDNAISLIKQLYNNTV